VFALLIGAVRTRTAQAVTVLVLTALATAVAVAGPWYGVAASSRAADVAVATAPAAQRVLSVRQIVAMDGSPRTDLDTFASSVTNLLPIRDNRPVLGLTQAMSVSRGGATQAIAVGYRDDFCTHLRLIGKCPAESGEVAISNSAAQQLGLDVGDRLVVRSTSTTPVNLRIAGRYDYADPGGAYWSNPQFRADGGLDPLFTPLDTFVLPELWAPTLAYDVIVPNALIRGDDGYDLGAALREADVQMNLRQLRLANPTAQILDTIRRDRETIELGVVAALLQVLVLAWFAIGLAGRYTGRERRGDAALLKLRGSTRTGMLRLTFGQHLMPVLGGLIVGAPAGYLLAWVLAGRVTAPVEARTAHLLSQKHNRLCRRYS
jgi:putative ABC transport system permease protein